MADFLNLKAVLSLTNSGFINGIKQAENTARQFSGNLKREFSGKFGAGASGGFLGGLLGVGSAYLGIRQVDQAIDRLTAKMKTVKEESQKTGLDAETVQKIINIGDINKAGNALEQVAAVQAQILGGDDKDFKLTKAMASLGVSMDDLKRKNHKQIFFQIGDAIKDAEINAEKLNALSKVLGGKGDDLIPMFKRGLNSPGASAGIATNAEVDEINKLQEDFKNTNSFGIDVANGIGRVFVGWLQKAKIGAAEILRLGETTREIYGPRASIMERIGAANSINMAKRIEARDAAKAAAQAEAEERRSAAEKAAKDEEERKKKLAEKLSEIDRRNKTKAVREHIQMLTSNFGMVDADVTEALRPEGLPLTAWQKGGEGARMGVGDERQKEAQRLININLEIKAELQRANAELARLNAKGDE